MSSGNHAEVLLAERYALREELGRGGMGVVWRAEDTLLEREVAIKEVRLPPELAGVDRSGLEARVLREARAAGRLGHPCAVAVYDVVRDQGRGYIVMELVRAPTLAQVVARDGPLDPGPAAAIGLQVLGALERAHSEGIVHRDVKPENVMLAPDGHAKLADFGIASLTGDPKLTATGVLLGSPAYMAPEQAQGEESGPAADLWALGATLYFAVEGEPPFHRGQPISTLAAVVYDEPRPTLRAGPLAKVLAALLAKAPGRRPRAAELRAALGAIAGGSAAPPAALSASSAPEREERPRQVASVARREDEVEARAVTGARVGGRWWWWVAALFVASATIGAAAGLGLLDSPRGEGSGSRGRAEDRSTTSTGGGRKDSGTAAVPSDPGGAPEGRSEPSQGVVPVQWTHYEEPSGDFSIAHPPNWDVLESSRDEDSVDFRDPATGTYVRVDWTDDPGPSPVASWRALERSFAASHDNYRRLDLAPARFLGYEAATWEFLYSEGGSDLHALDLGFVTGSHGFALFFQSRAEDWGDLQDVFAAFRGSFAGPA